MVKRHKGLHRYRLKQNPLEKKFAEEWERRNEDGRYGVLDYILAKDNNNPTGVTDRDAEVAATIIQWLGSPIGRNFLDTVLGTNFEYNLETIKK